MLLGRIVALLHYWLKYAIIGVQKLNKKTNIKDKYMNPEKNPNNSHQNANRDTGSPVETGETEAAEALKRQLGDVLNNAYRLRDHPDATAGRLRRIGSSSLGPNGPVIDGSIDPGLELESNIDRKDLGLPIGITNEGGSQPTAEAWGLHRYFMRWESPEDDRNVTIVGLAEPEHLDAVDKTLLRVTERAGDQSITYRITADGELAITERTFPLKYNKPIKRSGNMEDAEKLAAIIDSCSQEPAHN